MATQMRGENTRERILAATEALVLARGFTGTSIDEILKVTKLTKGAFFYHFRSKGDLARAVVERWVERDFALLTQLAQRADDLADDPLQAVLLFIKLVEESFENMPEPFPGCMLASYVYENEQFEDDINKFVADAFRRWTRLYEVKFDRVFAVRTPLVPVTAKDLAEEMACILEGAFIMSRAYADPNLIIRQSRAFRSQLQLMFGAATETQAPTAKSSA